jgi:predicted  nucleic acid-binding Zn-ribbon protein
MTEKRRVCYYCLLVIEYDGDKMAVTRQLYQLQEIDTQIEQEEQALTLKTGQLGKREALDDALNRLASSQQHLKELNRQRQDAEWEVDDILSKIATAEKQLYGGRITNPKELSSLQHEVNTMKSRSDQLETKALEAIDLMEEAEKGVAALYEKVRQQKKQAVAKVEQGICHACRISLSASVLQKARSGQPVQCGTCGRILFIS